MVDIINLGVGVDELDEELDNLNHILLGQHTCLHRDVHVQLVVDTVTAYLTQVITFVGEEQIHDRFASRCIISRLGVTNLAVDVQHSLFLRTGGILLQGIEQDRIIALVVLLFVQQHVLRAGLHNTLIYLFIDLRLTFDNDLVTLDGYHLGGILVNEILGPGLHYVTCQTTAYHRLLIRRRNLHLLGEVEAVKDILIALETDGTQKSCYRQLLLAVNVSIHHIVNVRRKLDPRAAERNDSCRIEFRTVAVHARAEKYTRRTVQLAHNDTLGAVDNERTLFGHVRDSTQINILYYSIKILVIRIAASQAEFGLQWNAIGQSALDALLFGVTGRINIVVQKFEREVVTRIGNREVLLKYAEQPFLPTLLGR